jgi:hypothetical protein
MAILVVLAAVVIIGGTVVAATGRGGELDREQAELPGGGDFRSWADVAEYRPPPALLGYHAGATEHALSLIARTIADRDAEILWLRRRLTELQPGGSDDELGTAANRAGWAGLADDPELAPDSGRADWQRPAQQPGPRPGPWPGQGPGSHVRPGAAEWAADSREFGAEE